MEFRSKTQKYNSNDRELITRHMQCQWKWADRDSWNWKGGTTTCIKWENHMRGALASMGSRDQ